MHKGPKTFELVFAGIVFLFRIKFVGLWSIFWPYEVRARWAVLDTLDGHWEGLRMIRRPLKKNTVLLKNLWENSEKVCSLSNSVISNQLGRKNRYCFFFKKKGSKTIRLKTFFVGPKSILKERFFRWIRYRIFAIAIPRTPEVTGHLSDKRKNWVGKD